MVDDAQKSYCWFPIRHHLNHTLTTPPLDLFGIHPAADSFKNRLLLIEIASTWVAPRMWGVEGRCSSQSSFGGQSQGWFRTCRAVDRSSGTTCRSRVIRSWKGVIVYTHRTCIYGNIILCENFEVENPLSSANLGSAADFVPVRADEAELSGHDQREKLLLVLVLAAEGRETTQQDVVYHPDSPHVYL